MSPWKMYKHIQIVPQPTNLPKPKIARTGGGRNVHFTDEWKQYATSIYPVDPSRYWNLPQSQYDLLIPVTEIYYWVFHYFLIQCIYANMTHCFLYKTCCGSQKLFRILFSEFSKEPRFL